MPATPTPAPRRHTPLAASKPDPRATARVTDAAGWRVKRPLTFNAAL